VLGSEKEVTLYCNCKKFYRASPNIGKTDEREAIVEGTLQKKTKDDICC